MCLFPLLGDIPYKICKATAPGNSVLIPLPIDDKSLRPHKGLPFQPVFSVSQLKGMVYIRTMEEVPVDSCPRLSNREVTVLCHPNICFIVSVALGIYTSNKNTLHSLFRVDAVGRHSNSQSFVFKM